jgi:hypothetical protein
MLIQETINEPDTLLKLLVSLDDQLQALQPRLAAQQLPRDGRGAPARLCAAEVLTSMIYGAWLGLTDKAKRYYYFQRHHWAEFPALPSYSKFVEATNRVVREAGALLGQPLQANRAAQHGPRWSCKTPRPCRFAKSRAPTSIAPASSTHANRATEAAIGRASSCTCSAINAGV